MDSKNVLLAVVLSTIVLIFWAVFFEIKQHGSFKKPKRFFNTLATKTTNLTKFQIFLLTP